MSQRKKKTSLTPLSSEQAAERLRKLQGQRYQLGLLQSETTMACARGYIPTPEATLLWRLEVLLIELAVRPQVVESLLTELRDRAEVLIRIIEAGIPEGMEMEEISNQ